jgi:uncharacterized RDD family membrane protein YckC
VTSQAKRVGFWLRALATLIDFVFVAILCFVAVTVLEVLGVPRQVSRHWVDAFANYTIIAVILLYTACDVIFRGTLGKIFVGLRIANADSSMASRWTLANRWTYKWMFLFVMALGVFFGHALLTSLGNLWEFLIVLGCFAAMGESKLTWHDRWARTAVFHEHDLNPEKSPAGFPVLPAQAAPQELPQ